MTSSTRSNATITDLQILRFVAAALVLISHVQHEALKGKFLNLQGYEPWSAIFFAGGVDIFFVISGFIMYTISSADFGTPGAAKYFLLRRLIRIAPPYWIFTTAMIAAALIFSGHVTHSSLDPGHVLASFLFLPYTNPYGQAYPVLMLGWTLNYEAYFYAVFALALLFPRKLGLLLLFAVIGVPAAFGMAGKVEMMPFSYWANPIVFEFLFGIGLAMLRDSGWRFPRGGGAAVIALGFGLMWLMEQQGIAGNYWQLRIFWMGLPALLICGGVVLAPPSTHQPGWTRRQLALLGDASYSIYLSHPFALNAVALVWRKVASPNPWVYVWVAIVVSIVVGLLVHLLIEKPMTSYFNRRLKKHLHAQPLQVI